MRVPEEDCCALEAGMFAIRAERDYVVEEDFMKAGQCFYLSLPSQCALHLHLVQRSTGGWTRSACLCEQPRSAIEEISRLIAT